MAYLNGTGRSRPGKRNDAALQMLNILIASTTRGTPDPRHPSKDKRRPEREPESRSSSRSGGFKNDPDDPANPNEARIRFIKKIDKQRNR
jgi:hypothetical protein